VGMAQCRIGQASSRLQAEVLPTSVLFRYTGSTGSSRSRQQDMFWSGWAQSNKKAAGIKSRVVVLCCI
jgi:hypothetical protein